VFAQKLRVTLRAEGVETPAPQAWLEQFFMRDFTGSSAFDETLVTGDGELEAGFSVRPEEARAKFERWLRGRKTIAAEAEVEVRASPAGPKQHGTQQGA
jgi:hypothetical protein